MFSGKVIAITGASSGIGAEMAKLFAEKDAIVILMARSLDKMDKLSTLI